MNIWLKRIRSFLNTNEEWHSFVIGFGDGAGFTKTDLDSVSDIFGEVHYYKFGVVLGRFAIIGFITGMLYLLI